MPRWLSPCMHRFVNRRGTLLAPRKDGSVILEDDAAVDAILDRQDQGQDGDDQGQERKQYRQREQQSVGRHRGLGRRFDDGRRLRHWCLLNLLRFDAGHNRGGVGHGCGSVRRILGLGLVLGLEIRAVLGLILVVRALNDLRMFFGPRVRSLKHRSMIMVPISAARGVLRICRLRVSRVRVA